MALSATGWKNNIENYNGKIVPNRSWSGMRNASYANFFFPNLYTTGYYFGNQVLYNYYNICGSGDEGYSPKPVENLYLYVVRYYYDAAFSFGVTYRTPTYGSAYSYVYHPPNNHVIFVTSWTNYGGFYFYGYSFYGVTSAVIASKSPYAFYQYYGSTNSNVAIGNTGYPYHRINTYSGQC